MSKLVEEFLFGFISGAAIVFILWLIYMAILSLLN